MAFALASLLCSSVRAAEGPTVYYVATNGSDDWSGTLPAPNAGRTDGPFATLYRARDAVRGLRTRGLPQPVRILVRGGTYYLPKTLTLGPEDSGTDGAYVSYESHPGEEVVLSGGRPITGQWRTDDGKVHYVDIPEARNGAWKFRQLFVDGRREIRARYPNYDASDVLTKGWLYAAPDRRYGVILSGLGKASDFLEHEFKIAAKATYSLWAGYATTLDAIHTRLGLKIDGQPAALGDMPASGGWRTVRWSRVAAVGLEPGRHVIRWEVLPQGGILHFDAFVFTDSADAKPDKEGFPPPAPGEHQVAVQAEALASRVAGQGSHVGGWQTFVCEGKASARTILCRAGVV
ncbi:MAG: hypothetical protein FJ272_14640, partial [Planctomycetes bacterium]|nr:hypothetical protein [Planctomycetota bacterium]